MSNGQSGKPMLTMPGTGGQNIPVAPEELFIMIGMKETEIAKLSQALMKLQQQNQQQAAIIKELQQKLAGTPDEPEEGAPTDPEEKEVGEKKDPGTAPAEKPEPKKIPKIKKIEKEE